MTPREIIAGRLADLVDRARKLPRAAVVVVGHVVSEAGVPWVRPGRTTVTDPRSWPAGLPLPLTVGDALDVLAPALDDIAADMLDELRRMVEALVPPDLADDVAEAVAAEWPLPDDRATPRDRALELIAAVASPFGPRAYRGRERVIAEWAADRLEARLPDFAAELRRNAPLFGGSLSEWRDDNGRWSGIGLALLWLAELDARPRAYALDAAADVRAHLAHLVDARDPSPEIFAALDVATRRADGTRDPLADVDPSTRGRWAGDVIAAAQGVARAVLALPEPTTEDDARAAAAAAAEVLAAALAKLGTAGRKRADKVRAKADERAAWEAAGELRAGELWGLWRGTSPPRWIEALARVLWADRWRPERARQAEDTFARLLPSVATAVVSMTKAAGTGDPYRDRIPLLDDKGRGLVDVLVDAHTTSLPAMTPDRLRRVFGSMTCHRWIRYALPELQALWRANNTATSLTISGGKSGIIQAMRAVGLGGSRADEDVIADVIPLVGAVVAPVGYGRKGNLYSYTIPSSPEDWRTRTGRPAQLITITPNEPLDPCILFDTRTKQAVPVDRELPPLGWVDRGQHAAVATLAILIAQNQIERRGEIAEHGGVLMTAEIWTEMINGANLRDPGGFLWTLTRDALTDGGRSDVGAAGGEPVPPFLDIVARERDGAARVILSAERPGIRAWLDRAVKGHEEHAAPKPQTPKRKRRR